MDIPTTEVKLVLDSKNSLKGPFDLSEELRKHFEVSEPQKRMKIWYLDTAKQELKKKGWIIRYRFHEGNDFELTFKKRYEEAEYFSLSGGLPAPEYFEPEIDMGVAKKTYSFSCSKKFAMNDFLYNLDLYEAKRVAIINSPAAFTDWGDKNYGFKMLSESLMYGPVEAFEYKGCFEDNQVSFEIWKLDEFLTEISLKTGTQKSAALMKKLQSDDIIKRLVLPEGKLKTEALFKYYSKHKELVISG